MRPLTVISLFFLFLGSASPQAKKETPATPGATKKGPASTAAFRANLAQLMRGTLFPASNVFFFAQSQNPAAVPQAKDPSTATDPLANTYGQWQAVENAALSMLEVADLLSVRGRKCSNGKNVPLQNADWPKLVQGLRDASLTAYKAAQSKNQDMVVDAAGTLSEACSNCHEKYRDKGPVENRCQ